MSVDVPKAAVAAAIIDMVTSRHDFRNRERREPSRRMGLASSDGSPKLASDDQ